MFKQVNSMPNTSNNLKLPWLITLFGFLWVLAGYSSGSAGGLVTPRADGARGVSPDVLGQEPPALSNASPPTAAPCNPPEASPCAPPAPGPTKAQANVEHELVSKALTRVKELEEIMLKELEERKRKAEEDFEQEMIQKKQRVQKEIEELVEQRNVEESRLALASEQLQEKMACVSEEQSFLDELKSKSKEMQHKLAEAAAEQKPADEKEKQKQALRLKLQAGVHSVPKELATPTTPAPSVQSASRQSNIPSPPSQDKEVVIVPVSTQRFTSSTHPEAWQYLYRMTKSPEKCDEEIYKAWHEGQLFGETCFLKKNTAYHYHKH